MVLSEISQVRKIPYCIMDVSGDLESAGESMVADPWLSGVEGELTPTLHEGTFQGHGKHPLS